MSLRVYVTSTPRKNLMLSKPIILKFSFHRVLEFFKHVINISYKNKIIIIQIYNKNICFSFFLSKERMINHASFKSLQTEYDSILLNHAQEA